MHISKTDLPYYQSVYFDIFTNGIATFATGKQRVVNNFIIRILIEIITFDRTKDHDTNGSTSSAILRTICCRSGRSSLLSAKMK